MTVYLNMFHSLLPQRDREKLVFLFQSGNNSHVKDQHGESIRELALLLHQVDTSALLPNVTPLFTNTELSEKRK